MTITPENRDYKVTFELAEGTETKKNVSEISVIRENRFMDMKTGEKLPVEVNATYADGTYEKVFGFEVTTDSDIVEVGDNGVITAKRSGEAVVRVNFKGVTKNVKIIIK